MLGASTGSPSLVGTRNDAAVGRVNILGRIIPIVLLGLAGIGWAWSLAVAGQMSGGSMAGPMTSSSMNQMAMGTGGTAISLAGFMLHQKVPERRLSGARGTGA